MKFSGLFGEIFRDWDASFGRAGLTDAGKPDIKVNTRLIMTLLVRDEVDVIEGNLRFHLDHGVDFIVAMDNGSIDGTTEILEEYVKKGVVHLIHEPGRVFDQRTWVNCMGELAYSNFSADVIFHADADEIWHPASGSLKNELCLRDWVDVLSVPVRNMMMADRDGQERFPDDVAYEISQPIVKPVCEVMREVEHQSFLLYRYPNKVIYRTRTGYVEVVHGNHDISESCDQVNMVKKPSRDIEILHFPVRGLEQFFRKTVNSGEGLANLDRHVGSDAVKAWHVKRWYALYREGRLDEEYDRLIINNNCLNECLKNKIVAPLGVRGQHALSYFENSEQVLDEQSFEI